MSETIDVNREQRRHWAQKTLQQIDRQLAAAQGSLLHALSQELDEAVLVVDAERNIVLFNRRAQELTGFSHDEVIGRHCLAGIRCTRCLENCGVFEHGKIHAVSLKLLRADNRSVGVVKSAVALRDEAGQIIGAVEVFHQKPRPRAEEEAPEPSARWAEAERLLGAIGRVFLILSPEGRIEHASKGFAELLGLPVESVMGRRSSEFLGEDLCGERSAFRRAIVAGQRREGWRALARHPDGHSIPLSVTGSRVQLDADAPRTLLVIRPEASVDTLDDAEATTFEGMVARSQSMRRIFELIDHLGDSDVSVLITGDSGTGKELVARAIHARSVRANRPFVAVNCGALPGDLLESELFGHARGAFTGSVRDKAGRFEVVADGTLFLDEIGDLPLHLQVKLLRVLQERSFERVGETTPRPFRARVVAATLQDLPAMVAARQFREDLFYRLNVVPIRLPPLRERREDLDMLIQHLLDKAGQRRNRALRLSNSAMRVLLSADWPGNVRQLENAMEYATAVCEGQTIHVEDLPPELLAPAARPSPQSATDEASHTTAADSRPGAAPSASTTSLSYPGPDELHAALRQARGHRGRAAKILGISRTTLWRKLKELSGGE